jgi:hypothetical protein
VSEDATAEKLLKQMLAPARELDERLSLDEAELVKRLATVKAERAKLLKVIRALDPMEPAPGRPKQRAAIDRGGNPESYTISEGKLAVIGAVVVQHEDEFSGAEIANEMGIHHDQVRRAFYWMRDRGQIRQVRIGGRTGQTRFYVVTDKGKTELSADVLAGANGTVSV